MEIDPLDAALAQIRHDYGDGAVMRLGEASLAPVAAIGTGCIGLDEALGVGGLPRGRVVELYGPESSGKTSLALSVAARAQAGGGVAAFIDAEHAFDPTWAATLGVDIDALLVSQPDSGEEALDIAEKLIGSGKIAVVVIDSVAALVPKAELAGVIGDTHVGLQARMMSQALRKLTGLVSNAGTCCLFINQLREKIGVYFANNETQPGGKALKFYSSVRLDVRRVATIKDGTEAVGNRVKVKVVKNKCARPFRWAEFDLYFADGISRESELLDLGVEREVVKKSGAFYSYEGEAIGQGREKARLALLEQPDLAARIESSVRSRLGGKAEIQ